MLNVLALGVDTAMCGRLADSDQALTALGFSTQVFFILLVATMGLIAGGVALVSRAWGAGDRARAGHAVHQTMQLTVLMGAATAAVGVPLAPYILQLLGADAHHVALAMQYLEPMLYGAVFYYLNIAMAGVLRGVGNTVLAFRVALGSNALNALLNYGFILGGWGFPSLGLQGAAYGTVISNAVAFAAIVALVHNGAIRGLYIRLRPARIDRPLAAELWQVGWPAAMDMIVLNVMLASIVGMIGRLDPIAVAAHGVGIRIQALAFVPGLGVSQATGALVGMALGRGDVEEAREALRAARVLCSVMMTGIGVVFMVLAGPLLTLLFDLDAGTAVHTYAVQWMRILGAALPIVGVWLAYSGLLHGSGDTFASLRINATTTLLIQVPSSALLGLVFGLGPAGVWLGLPLGEVFKVVLGHRAFRAGAWARTGVRVKPT